MSNLGALGGEISVEEEMRELKDAFQVSGMPVTRETRWQRYCIVLRCWNTLAPPPYKQIVRHKSNKPIKSKLTFRQSINQSTERFTIKVYAWLIDWLNPPSEKLPHGDDFRVGPKSERTPRDNTVLLSVFTTIVYNNPYFVHASCVLL